MKEAGIDVDKKVLMVVVVDASTPEEKPARRRFVTMASELHRLLTWLREQGVEEAVMESTAVGVVGTGAPHAFALGAGIFQPCARWA